MENLKYTEILGLNKKLAEESYDKALSIKILSNVTINSFKEILEYNLRQKKVNPIIEIGNFDNIVQDSLNPGNHNLIFVFYDILNIVDSFSDFFESLTDASVLEFEQKIKNEIGLILRNLEAIPTVVFNTFSTAPVVSSFIRETKLEKFVHNLNHYLYSLEVKNLVLVNIDKIVFELGRGQAYDFRFYHSSKAPYTISFFKTYCKAIESTILKLTGGVKKAIIFDCDNTLWKGVVGEDGAENLHMSSHSSYGKSFYDVQCIAKHLSKNGVLIGICSKNNLEDVEDIINNHKDMVLSNDDIVIKKVNWIDKATNLKEISIELNIGVDSILFVDDSDYEINLIRERLPEVKTFQVPKNIYSYKNELLNFIYQNFQFVASEEDKRKTEQYKEQKEREKEKNNFDSIDSYISSLKIKLEIYKNCVSQVPRIAQLTQKTNQFNLTTKRYTEVEIEKLMSSPDNIIFTATVSDKFGESGLTVLCIVNLVTQIGHASIDTLLMSCRVIGRNIEFVFMDYIFQFLKTMEIQTVESLFIRTEKNSLVQDFYDKMNFSLRLDKSNIKEYILDLNTYQNLDIDYIDLKKI